MSINQQSSSSSTLDRGKIFIPYFLIPYLPISIKIPSYLRGRRARHRRDLRTKQSPNYEKHKWMAELRSDRSLFS